MNRPSFGGRRRTEDYARYEIFKFDTANPQGMRAEEVIGLKKAHGRVAFLMRGFRKGGHTRHEIRPVGGVGALRMAWGK